MQFRITISRAAIAALFVVAGIGLGTLLSPLIGDAFATAGQIVNVSDPTAAFTAKVTSNGELKTNGVVSGKVAPALPPQPFNVTRGVLAGSNGARVLGPTTATVALTDVRFSNYFGNDARRLGINEYSAPAPNTNCTDDRTRGLGTYDLGPAQTVVASFETPIVLKPLSSGDAWCLTIDVVSPGGANTPDGLSLGGYVVAGTFTP
jgi:hypothetical protein